MNSLHTRKIRKLTIFDKIAMVFCGSVFFLIAIFSVFVMFNAEPQQQEQKANNDDANIIAPTLCKIRVESTLKAPRTAKFPWANNVVFDGSLAIMSSYVDAQNGFGAMIRTNYICTVRYKGGEPDDLTNWSIEELIIE